MEPPVSRWKTIKPNKIQISIDFWKNLKATAPRTKTHAVSTLPAALNNRLHVGQQNIDRQWKESCCLNPRLMTVLYNRNCMGTLLRGCMVSGRSQACSHTCSLRYWAVLSSPGGIQAGGLTLLETSCGACKVQLSYRCHLAGDQPCDLPQSWCSPSTWPGSQQSDCLLQTSWSLQLVLPREAEENQHVFTAASTWAVCGWGCCILLLSAAAWSRVLSPKQSWRSLISCSSAPLRQQAPSACLARCSLQGWSENAASEVGVFLLLKDQTFSSFMPALSVTGQVVLVTTALVQALPLLCFTTHLNTQNNRVPTEHRKDLFITSI